MDTRFRVMIGASLLLMVVSFDAMAASVYVRLESARTIDPLSISVSDATHSASADLTTGNFLVLATEPVGTTAVNAGAGIQSNLTFTNNNAFPFTIWAGTFSAHVEGAYSVVPPAVSLATGVDSTARLAIATSGATYSARYEHTLRANGNPASDQNVLTPTSGGGGVVAVSEASFTNLVVDLVMPAFTLLPGETMILSFQVDVTTQRNSSADFLNGGGAQLAFDLPAGITLDTNSSGPLDWVTVPEAGVWPMLAAGLIGIVGFGRGRGRVKRIDHAPRESHPCDRGSITPPRTPFPRASRTATRSSSR